MNNIDLRFHITFLRHGESVGNAEDRLQGQADFPLSPVGEVQARALAARWQAEGMGFDLIISSPQSRAKQTAQIVSEALGAPVTLDPLWMERHNGKATGLRYSEVRELYPADAAWGIYDNFAETGEGDWELFLRAGKALHALLKRPPARYLVVSHGGTLNQTMYALMGISPRPHLGGTRFRFDNTGYASTVFDPQMHAWRILCVNDHAHLKDIEKS